MKNIKSYSEIYEDNDILLISKAHGVYVIPDRLRVEKDILIDTLRNDYGSNILTCHRLDAGTGGLMIFAKHIDAQRKLSADFENGKIEKKYIAIVKNKICDQTIMLPIAKANHGRYNINFKSGKKAVTSFTTLYTDNINSVIECRLYTGRTHQIRVHLKAVKAPLYQDFLYNEKIDDKRLTLFHHKISFQHPITNNEIEYSTDLSDFMIDKLNFLGLNNKFVLI